MILGVPSLVKITLFGFKSRWMIPALSTSGWPVPAWRSARPLSFPAGDYLPDGFQGSPLEQLERKEG